jgi:hypothetical protein
MSSRTELLRDPAALGVLVVSVWLMARWLWRRPAPERWLGITVSLPLLGVAEHWWHRSARVYGSDSLAAHLWLAAFQVLGLLAVARLSIAPARYRGRVSPRDERIGLATAGLAGICAAMFILAYGEHVDLFVAPFPVNTPGWWRTIGWHGWAFWFMTGIGLLFSSRAMRRGQSGGYVGVALVASFVGVVHWATFQLGDPALGATANSVALILGVCVLCWILAGHRMLAANRSV